MSSRDEVKNVRVVKVTKNGKEVGFSSLGDKLKQLSPQGFVAVDAEFSGLGTDPNLKDEDLEKRYTAIRTLANSRAILSVGISLFDRVKSDVAMTDLGSAPSRANGESKHIEIPDPVAYHVATYDMLMSCQSEFSVNSDAGEFLVAHSFDFNEMFRNGIPYDRASTDKPEEKPEPGSTWRWGKLPRGMLWRIGRQGVPFIVHNGLFDLAFLYAAFQGPLPDSLQGFVSELLECNPAGYWDSKVLASCAKERTTFLGYLFAKSVLSGMTSVHNFSGLPSDLLTNPKIAPLGTARETLCALFAFRGFCPRGTKCPFSHDPFMVVAEEQKGQCPKDNKEAYKRHKAQSKNLKKERAALKSDIGKLTKKQRKRLLESPLDSSSSDLPPKVANSSAWSHDESSSLSDWESPVHTAGWDAFCTGYVFAAYRQSLSTENLNKERNRIALPYKLNSLLLCKSQFAQLDAVCPNGEAAQSATGKPSTTIP